jgi:ElaB/YqjD/DUF883 family membrane-anchored ribosome-binding protein
VLEAAEPSPAPRRRAGEPFGYTRARRREQKLHRYFAEARRIASDFGRVVGATRGARNLHWRLRHPRRATMNNTLDEARDRVGDNFNELRDELTQRTQEIRDTVYGYVDEHPLAAVGIAFGVGYLLSGALFSRTTFKVASLGGRFVLGGVLKNLVAGIGPGMLFGGGEGREEMGSRPSTGNGNANR